ncbi:MAG: N-acetylmuramoyl-L-alanine amidase [Clostridium celatum]|nr:N-acetylmuramoyl-L-alanine amidase [Clostridium celatum]
MASSFIDAGHGRKDSGASGNGLKEKDIVLSIATKLGSLLNERRISIKYSRTNDTYLSLEERARIANA